MKQGEVVGIIGRNGAGKSTLLKILSRITEPTEGRIKIRGRVASLLEVGTGFHPELTGRENIFLNGAILGMHRHEIKAKFDEIVAFAEVEKFLDTPVKRFSSGMYVRLAFAVAAHLEPEILIIDEVLAVGDAEFQRKCLGKMHNVAREGGRTVLFVSHNMAVIRSLCPETILLASGKIAYIGQTHIAAQRYVKSDLAALTTMEPRQHDPSGKPRILSAEIQSAVSAANTNVRIRTTIGSSPGVKFGIEIRVNDSQGAPVGFASVGLLDSDSLVHLNSCQESWILALLVPRLARGIYALRLQLTVPMVEVLDVFPDEITFEVDPAPLAKNGRVFEGQWGYGAVEIPLVIQRS